jgi:hypothetical protein
MEKLVIYPDRLKLAAIALGCAIFIAGGVWVAQLEGINAAERMIVLFVGIPFFSICLTFAFVRLVTRGPLLVVDEEGIFDAGSLFAAGPIPWSDVRDVVVSEYEGHRFLGIVPADVETFLAKRSAITRWWMRRNMDFGTPPVVIAQSLLPIEIEPLRARMLRALEESRGH